jgi:hypothetical protein
MLLPDPEALKELRKSFQKPSVWALDSWEVLQASPWGTQEARRDLTECISYLQVHSQNLQPLFLSH